MYNNKFFAALAAMLLVAFSQGFAQTAEQTFKREIALGANRGGGSFNPRVLYKRTHEKFTFRASFSGSAAHSRRSITNTDSCFGSGSRNAGVSALSFGAGFEKRKLIRPKFSMYYGMEFRLGLSSDYTSTVRNFDACTTFAQEEKIASRDYTGTLSLYPFIGVRYDLIPRLSVAVEVGPEAGLRGSLSASRLQRETQSGTQSIQRTDLKANEFETGNFLDFKPRPFITVAYHF